MTKTPKTTSAQRQAALRQRARALAYRIEDDDIRTAPDTAVLEAVGIAYRLRQAAVVENIMVDLLRRLGVTVTVTHVRPVEELTTSAVTVTPEPIEPIPVTVTPDPAPATDRDTRIMTLHMAGESKRSIARAVGCSDGTVRNVIKSWRS